MQLPKFKIYYWPGLTCAWFIFTFIASYLVSVLDGNVYAFFPYISDTGALPPESCIFGQLLNIGAILLAISMYIRYRQVDFALNSDDIDLKRWWNTSAIVFGIVACLGVSIVANFQETDVESMHFLGALMAFGIGMLYFFIQTRISYDYTDYCRTTARNIDNLKISKLLFYLRVFLAFWLLPLFLANMICATISMNYFTGESIVWWTEEDGGFQLRLAGSFTEWILAIFIFLYIASFTNEFKSLKYKGIYLERKIDDKSATTMSHVC